MASTSSSPTTSAIPRHCEAPETLKFTYPDGDAQQVKKYLAWIANKADLEPDDYQGALLYLAINENSEHE